MSVQDFRRALRDQVPQGSHEWIGKPLESEIFPAANPIHFESTDESPVAVDLICGCWRDQRGSVHKLSLGRAGAFHDETTRPNGQRCYTRDLVRVALVRGRQTAFWGRCGYELERRGSNALLWRGFSVHDVFFWHNIRNCKALALKFEKACYGQKLPRALLWLPHKIFHTRHLQSCRVHRTAVISSFRAVR